MKIQDIFFVLVLTSVLIIKKPRLFLTLGLFSLVLSALLFSKWIFFTAERLTWYAAVLFLVAIFQILWRVRNT